MVSKIILSICVVLSVLAVDTNAYGGYGQKTFTINVNTPPPVTKKVVVTYNPGPQINYFQILDQALASLIRIKQDKIASLVREMNRINEENKKWQAQAATAKPVTYTFTKQVVPAVVDINVQGSFSYGKTSSAGVSGGSSHSVSGSSADSTGTTSSKENDDE